MIKIALVEDEEIFSTQLKKYIERYAKENYKDVEIINYNNPLTFLKDFHSNVDILFTDIKMPNMTGIELAEKLREIDKDLIIIFTTSFKQYAIEGYSFQALGYLLKPIDYNNFSKTIERAFNVLDTNSAKFITVKNEGIFKKISAKDIVFIEVLGRELNIHLNNKKIVESRGTLSDLEKQLSSFGFFRCEHSFLVNLQYVSSVEKNEIIIESKKIPISRGAKKKFMNALAEYLNLN